MHQPTKRNNVKFLGSGSQLQCVLIFTYLDRLSEGMVFSRVEVPAGVEAVLSSVEVGWL